MSKLDDFAAAALTGILSNNKLLVTSVGDKIFSDAAIVEVCAGAFAIADKMVKLSQEEHAPMLMAADKTDWRDSSVGGRNPI